MLYIFFSGGSSEIFTAPIPDQSTRGRTRSQSTSNKRSRSSSLPPARKLRKDGQPSQAPITVEDYKAYADVLPSARSIHKKKMRITNQCEVDLAIALVKCIQRGLKSCIHYDTTQRSGIPGDFVSLVMSFSNLESFRFMPLYFAYEDRENIIRYFVESYQRLSICSTEVQGHPVSAASLWEKTDAIMTDAVAKNLKIEDGIAQQLGSDHIPKHLLCKSHTVEALDDSNIKVLAEIEQSCKFRQNLEAMFPAIKRFTRGSLSVVVTGIITILNWISHHKSALPTNVADLFDKVCEEEGRTRTFNLYQQRRFAKLGYLAGAILDAMDLLVILLDRVPDQNLHVESVRIFVECEFFSTALACLSYFQHNVTFPFLMLVQFSSQGAMQHSPKVEK